MHALRGETYERIAQSEIFRDLDLETMATLALRRDQTEAVREFRRRMRP